MSTRRQVYGIALVLTCSLAATVKAQNLYVGNGGNGTIGEYGLNGSTVNASLISGLDGPVLGLAINPVPEPSAGALAASFAAALMIFRRWKR